MRLLMIGVLYQNKSVIGYRLFDVESKEKKYIDAPEKSVKEVLSSGKATIENLGLQDGELVGTNGIIERYPKLNRQGMLITSNSPLTIVNQLGNAGYTVVDHMGTVKKVRVADVVKYAKQHGISNGKVVSRDNIEFISSITGNYKIEEIPKSKTENNSDVKINIALKNVSETGGVAQRASEDIDVQIGDIDVFECMSEEQKQVLKGYYVWYTVDKYKSLAKSLRLNIPAGKVEKLAELRGIEDWEFGGVWDTGVMGGSACALGHPLRYEYYAVPCNDRDNEYARLVFGELCASDFFNISPEQMRNLVKTRKIMSDEIKLISDAVLNEQEHFVMLKAELLYAIIRKLGTKENILEVFGTKVGYTILSFLVTKLPMPMSLVLECSKAINEYGIMAFYKQVFPEYADGINYIYSTGKRDTVMEWNREYLNFIATNKIEGHYAYDPLNEEFKRRDVGKYNKTSRWQRHRLLNGIFKYACCTKFTFEELETYLYCWTNVAQLYDKVAYKLRKSSYGKADTYEVGTMAEDYIRYNNPTDTEMKERVALNNLFVAQKYASGFTEYDKVYTISRVRNIEVVKEIFDFFLSSDVEGIMQGFVNYVDKVTKPVVDKEEDKPKENVHKEEVNIPKNEQNSTEEDNLDKLRRLMESRTDIEENDGITIAKSIINTYKSYKDLTPKQKWRIDNTIKIYEGSQEPDKTNNKYSLDDRPDVKSMVERLLSKADDVEMQKVLEVEPVVLKIAFSVTKYNKVSDKQLKHILKAIEILDKQ